MDERTHISAFAAAPRWYWWPLAIVACGAVAVIEQRDGLTAISLPVTLVPLFVLWICTVGRDLRPLSEGDFATPLQATVTLLMQPARFCWSWALGILMCVFGPWGPDDPGFGSALLIAATVPFFTFPVRGGWRTIPLAVAVGLGPRSLPTGTRWMVFAVLSVLALAVLAAVGVLGGAPVTGRIAGGLMFMAFLLSGNGGLKPRSPQGAAATEPSA